MYRSIYLTAVAGIILGAAAPSVQAMSAPIGATANTGRAKKIAEINQLHANEQKMKQDNAETAAKDRLAREAVAKSHNRADIDRLHQQEKKHAELETANAAKDRAARAALRSGN